MKAPRHKGEDRGRDGVRGPQTKACLKMPDPGRARDGSSFRGFGGSLLLLTCSLLTSNFPNCERTYFCCFVSLSLWYFVTAALGN